MPRSYTILVVDDEAALLEIYRSALSESGHTVLTTADGYKSIRILVERHVDLLITDINMPRLNGVHQGAQARLMCPSIHVIYITGFGDRIDRIALPRLGVVMRKPIRAAALRRAVEQEMAARG